MERRLILAIALMIVVAVLPSVFMKPAARRPVAGRTAVTAESTGAAATAPPAAPVTAPQGALVRPRPPAAGAPAIEVRAETVAIATPRARYRFSTLGAAPA